jgi:hypothetical protein
MSLPDFVNEPNKYKIDRHILTELINSTLTVQTKFINTSFDIQTIVSKLETDTVCIKLDTNFGHKKDPSYPEDKVKSNKGRKKKIKPVSERKKQGDGTTFNGVLNIVVRIEKSYYPEKIQMQIIEDYKLYKFKLFGNGTISIPGALMQDLSDAVHVVEIVRDYLNRSDPIFNITDYEPLKIIMLDYKFGINIEHFDQYNDIIGGAVDLNNLKNRWTSERDNLINISGDSLISYLNYYTIDEYVDMLKLNEYTQTLYSDIRPVWVDKGKLKQYLSSDEIQTILKKREIYFEGLKMENIQLPSNITNSIKIHLFKKAVMKILEKIDKDPENMRSSVKYNNGSYQGLILSINTPNPSNKEKKTKIKIFASGKVNIDGANSHEEAIVIYEWINYIFVMNYDDFIINPENPKFLEKDPDYSTDEGDEYD